ncbi:DUF4177 domain-containing protein [Crassaminicella thermophila]|uniref:DUF4177 domain-containing protein n=1 Tax=Crassaminicella thermophila TaxID=2599308 RepID=A0A5C0SF73_CRATE|nr:DUF4177 domain-containing protein [Crassaminicella thermophila]QEK12387.1 DUF4177 domain-containing protein [Crassaminicella thermophila]
MKKWEYKIINLRAKGVTNLVLSKEDEEELNKLGDEGWELVSSVPTVNGRTICCMLKREK